MNRKTLERLCAIANELDSAGLFKAASLLDRAADLIILAQDSKKAIHATFSKEGGKVVCKITLHELENPNPIGEPLVFSGHTVDAARKAAASALGALKTEHGVSQVVEQFINL